MRSFLLGFIVFLALCVCSCSFPGVAKTKPAYTSNGVGYFGKPVHELGKLTTFNTELKGAAVFTMVREPVVVEGSVYLPTQSHERINDKFNNTAKVYRLDAATSTFTDSLLLGPSNSSLSISQIIVKDGLYLFGIKDTLCVIYQTDLKLKITSQHKTTLKAGYVVYAGFQKDYLRIVTGYKNAGYTISDFYPVSFKLISQKMIGDIYDSNHLNGSDLWCFKVIDKKLQATVYDLAKADAPSTSRSFDITMPDDTPTNKTFSPEIIDNTLYIHYTRMVPQVGSRGKLLSINLTDNTTQSRDIEGRFHCTLEAINGKTYIYGIKPNGFANTVYLAELGKDLQESTPLVEFKITDFGNPGRIVSLGGNKVLLTGSYLVDNHKKQSFDTPKGKVTFDDVDSINFYTTFELK